MKRLVALYPVLGIVAVGCAGTLDSPERFEQNYGTAKGGDAGASASDAGSPAGNDDASAPGPAACNATELLAARCGNSGCHSAAEKVAGIDLLTEGVGQRLKDVAASASCGDYVQIDGDAPDQSLIYLKVTDTPPCGSRMPVIGAPFTAEEQACLLGWLEGL